MIGATLCSSVPTLQVDLTIREFALLVLCHELGAPGMDLIRKEIGWSGAVIHENLQSLIDKGFMEVNQIEGKNANKPVHTYRCTAKAVRAIKSARRFKERK